VPDDKAQPDGGGRPGGEPADTLAVPGFDAVTLQTDRHELVLVKGGRRHVFRCVPGREHELMRELADMACDCETDITWYDAAMLTHHLGRRLRQRLDRMSRKAG